MGYADDFYVTVRSMDSLDYFPNNTASDFNVRLPYKLMLEGNWKVGVNEIWITKHWFNLTDASIQLSVNDSEFEEWYLLSGYYEDNLTLIHELNKLLDSVCKGCGKFSLNQLNQRVSIITEIDIKLKLSENICSLIGMDYGEIINVEWSGEKTMDIHEENRMVAVCVDFTSEQLFSDNVVNVIKMLDSSYQYYGEVIHDNILSNYVNVRKDTINTIHVKLSNLCGKSYKSQAGSCIVQFRFTREA